MITFQKGIFGKQAKQTNDCGYIVAYNGKLTKLDERGETKWESEITLDQILLNQPTNYHPLWVTTTNSSHSDNLLKHFQLFRVPF